MLNLEKVFENVCNATEGKCDNSRYIMRFNSLDEMLEEYEMTLEQVQEKTSFNTFDVSSIKDSFIVSDYAKDDFCFLTNDNEEDIQKFIDYLISK